MLDIVIYMLTSGGLFFLSFLTLATPRNVNVTANRWLGLFLFAFGCAVLDRVLFDGGWYEHYPDLKGLMEATRFAMAPALYFSVCYFTSPDRKFQRAEYLHFVPFLLFFCFVVLVITRLNESVFFDWYRDLPATARKVVAITVFSSVKIQMIVYWILSYRKLIQHRRWIKLFASTIEPVSLDWLKYFLLGVVGVLILSLNDVIQLIPALIPVTGTTYLLLVFYIGFYSVRQNEVYPYPKKDIDHIKEIIEVDRDPVKTSRIPEDVLQDWKDKLTRLMQSEKVYLDPDLGLPQLAQRLGLSTHDLSYVINEGFQENFFQFVNRYRIEEAKYLLRSEKFKHLNILGIAFESGFRSKTTFNTTFKKLTGLSPSAFMAERPVPDASKG